ncbi:CAP domain-containing protein, partial [Reichenbachiella sp.]
MKKSAALFIITIFSSQLLLAQKANDQEMKLLIEKHNYWRSEVGIGDISYSDELATAANSWAIELKKQGCNFSTSQNAYGENIFKGTVGYFTVGDAVDSWG